MVKLLCVLFAAVFVFVVVVAVLGYWLAYHLESRCSKCGAFLVPYGWYGEKYKCPHCDK